jgi:hypothetical protein
MRTRADIEAEIVRKRRERELYTTPEMRAEYTARRIDPLLEELLSCRTQPASATDEHGENDATPTT